MKKLTRTLALIGYLALASIPLNAAAAVVIDFQTGAAGAGGTITESGGDVVGTNINISLMILDGTSNDGSYVADAKLNFDTAAGTNTIDIVGTVNPFVVIPTTLLSGSFDSFTYSVIGGNEFFTGTGPDVKSCALLCEIGVDPNTPFEFFGISIESVNGTVISTDIVNTAVPVPAAVWLFGSGLLGLVGVARRRRS